MSLISTKGAYGLAAMYELSSSSKENPMQTKDISDKTNVPKNYLEQILPLLKKAGLIGSFRGANGGYYIAKNPSEISIKDIFIALEGKLQIANNEVNPICKLFFNEFNEKLQNLFDLPLDKLNIYKDRILGQINYII